MISAAMAYGNACAGLAEVDAQAREDREAAVKAEATHG